MAIGEKTNIDSSSLERRWLQKARSLTRALVISGALNIALLSTLIIVSLKERQIIEPVSSVADVTIMPSESTLPKELADPYQQKTWSELVADLDRKKSVYHTYKERDFALSYLYANYFFDLERALGRSVKQQRVHLIPSPDHIPSSLILFPRLDDTHFEAVKYFIKTEKWPFTPQGLFEKLKEKKERSLLETFYLIPDFENWQEWVQYKNPSIAPEEIVDALLQVHWGAICEASGTALLCDNSGKKGDLFLSTLFKQGSTKAGEWLGKNVKAVPTKKTASIEKKETASKTTPSKKESPAPKRSTEPTLHIVSYGESLWTIAKKYQLSVDDLKRFNYLESDRLSPGQELVIPEH